MPAWDSLVGQQLCLLSAIQWGPSTASHCFCLASMALGRDSCPAVVELLLDTSQAVLQPASAAWHRKEAHNGCITVGAMQICDHILSSHHPDALSKQEDDSTTEVANSASKPRSVLINLVPLGALQCCLQRIWDL